jgi:hypothetical protein
MTNFTSRLAEGTRLNHESGVWFESETKPGVRFRIRRVSLARRIDLATRIRETARRLEFLEAASGAMEQVEAAVLRVEIDRVYLDWALEEVQGLEIDDQPATPDLAIERGPLDLAEEMLRRIKAECGLNQAERKN